MPRLITVVTPENVRIEYELAGIASRAGAAIIDTVILGMAVGLLLAGQALLQVYGRWPGTGWAEAVLGIAAFALFYGYFVFFETVWNGQTPGKRAARLRVVRVGGLPVDLQCAAVRNLVRIIDFVPPPYLIGGVCILVTSRGQRLGDLAAGTLVVKERSEWTGDLRAEGPILDDHYPESALVTNVELVTPEEFEAARRFLERRAELQLDVREELAARIAGPIIARLGIEPQGPVVYSNLLAEVYRKCCMERGMR